MRILYYNWVPFDENLRGGGVTVYTRNLINSLIKQYPESEVFFLCAGSYFDTEDTSIRYTELALKNNVNCKAFTIINSPVFAPAYLSFYHLDKLMNDKSLKCVLESFLNENGPFDVVHFQNLEGLSLDAMSLKKKFPNTKFIYSLHNYFAFCPRVDLWRNFSENCDCSNTGAECLSCMLCHVPSEKLKKKMAIDYMQRLDNSNEKAELYSKWRQKIDRQYEAEEKKELSEEQKEELSTFLDKYRKRIVDIINENMDSILAVSERVKEIAIRCGVDASKLQTSYIGTEVAENAINYYKGATNTPLTMVYMGYQNEEKGFFFLLEVLKKLDDDIAKKLKLLIVARGNVYSEEMLNLHRQKFYDVEFKNGYGRDEIPSILSRADFGIVPVLWEDNLPQVAIEMVANGVPVICSNRGGAKELSSNSEFVFAAGDTDDCIKRISTVVNSPNSLKTYYDDFSELTTMKKHIEELMILYNAKQ